MSAKDRPALSVVDDPLAAAPVKAKAPARVAPIAAPTAPPVVAVAAAEPERTVALFARLPASLGWAVESAALGISASDRRRGKVAKQELLAALIWRGIGTEPAPDMLAELGELVDAYREAQALTSRS